MSLRIHFSLFPKSQTTESNGTRLRRFFTENAGFQPAKQAGCLFYFGLNRVPLTTGSPYPSVIKNDSASSVRLNPMRTFKRVVSNLSWLILWAFALTVTVGCSKSSDGSAPSKQEATTDKSKKQKQTPIVRVLVLQPQNFEKKMRATATVEAVRHAQMSSPAEGPVVSIHAREGDVVKKNTQLLEIGRNASSLAVLVAAEASLNRYRLEYERAQALVEKGAVSQEVFDTAKSAFSQAQAVVESARQGTGDFTIRAPWDGIISRIRAQVGSVALPRQTLIELYDPTSCVLRFELTEEQAMSVKVGQSVVARFAAYPGKTEFLRITRAWPELDRVTRKRLFEAELSAGERTWIPGLFAEIEWVAEAHTGVWIVPTAALLGSPSQGYRIFKMIDGDRVHSVAVTVLADYGEMSALALSESLTNGDRVVVEGAHFVNENQLVHIEKSR